MTWLDTEAFGECRTITGHRWERGKHHPALDGSDLYMHHVCVHCRAQRHVWFNIWSGATRSRWYEYPVGYLVVGKGKRLSKNAMRVQFMKRHVLRGRGRGRSAA